MTAKPPPRKNVGLPKDLIDRVEQFRQQNGFRTESEAIRALIRKAFEDDDRRDLTRQMAPWFEVKQ